MDDQVVTAGGGGCLRGLNDNGKNMIKNLSQKNKIIAQ